MALSLGPEMARIAALRQVYTGPRQTPTHPDGTFTFHERNGLTRAETVQVEGRCPRCGGHGVVPAPVVGTEKVEFGRCRCCMRPLDQARAFNAAQIPGRYGVCTLESWVAGEAQRGVRDRVLQWAAMAEDKERHPTLTTLPGVALCGEPGRGKTHLAVGLLRRLLLEGRRLTPPLSARYVEPNQLLQTMKARMAGVVGPPVDIEALVAVDVLLLDDVVAPRTDFERSIMDELITRRWQRGGTTLVTTNMTEREAKEAFGERVASRLSALEWLPVTGVDRRHRRAA